MSNDEGSLERRDASTVKEAKAESEPVSLRAGRAGSHVGFNRRLVNKAAVCHDILEFSARVLATGNASELTGTVSTVWT